MGVSLVKIPVFLLSLIVFCIFEHALAGTTRHYHFEIRHQNVTRLCHTKSIVTVNGQFPGPRIVAREGDRLLIKVTNHVQNNISVHWHGIRQLQSGWADGPSYVTQCPIQTNRPNFCLQLHNCWSERHSLVSCSHFMVKINFVWSSHHSSQAQCSISFCQTPQGSSYHI
ncbi:hypothetical protein AAZV13_08G320650 [Glycine max]